MDFSEDDEFRALRETVRAWTRRPMVESTPDTLERMERLYRDVRSTHLRRLLGNSKNRDR